MEDWTVFSKCYFALCISDPNVYNHAEQNKSSCCHCVANSQRSTSDPFSKLLIHHLVSCPNPSQIRRKISPRPFHIESPCSKGLQ